MIRFLAQLRELILGKAAKCMRLACAAGLAAGLLGCTSAAWADHSSAVVIASSEQVHISAGAYFWHEQPGKLTIDKVSEAAIATRFMPLQDEKMFDLKPADRLWIRLEIEKKESAREHTILWLPLPLLDTVTVYEWQEYKDANTSGTGRWKSQRAGDLIAVANWPEPGRYPRFHLMLPPGKSTVYIQVQGSTPLSVPIFLGSEIQAQVADREGFLGMGLVVGVLLTLVLMCFVTAYTYNDRLYLLYGVYMLLMVLAVGAYTGISAYLLWNHSPVWADAAQGALALITAGGALYFIEAMLGGRQFARKLSAYLLGLGALALPLAVVYCFVPRELGVTVLGVYMMMVSSIGLTLAVRAWKRGDRVGKWICFAYAPLALAVLIALARAFGWISVSWAVQYGVVIALMIEAPMMMVALHVRSRERHEISTREKAMTTQDALTGLLVEHIFDDRIAQTLSRYVKRREDAAIVLISLVNYQDIATAYGLPVAEQSVLRAVIKLRKVVRDVESVARVGTSHFGLILEGAAHRGRITDIGARLIAQGLMPLPGLVPEVTLQFHLAAVVLKDLPQTDPDIKGSLFALLKSMSPRTRRPIRFLEAVSTGGTPLTRAGTSPAVDALAAQVQAAEPPPEWQSTAAIEPNSSGSSWSGGQSSMPSQEPPETVAQPR